MKFILEKGNNLNKNNKKKKGNGCEVKQNGLFLFFL